MPKIDTRRRPTQTSLRTEPRSRLQRFTAEVRLTAAFIGWILLSLSLLSFHKSDPSWSSSGTGHAVANWVGVLGAWFSDVAYFLLGFSALWLIPLGLYGVLRMWRNSQRAAPTAEAEETVSRWQKLRPIAAVAGVLLLPLSSAALESTRLWSLAAHLPGEAGGLLGHALGAGADTLLGDTGGTLVLLAVFLFALSWVG
ncbi:MAG: cell division protein FtsK, partial [Thiomonas sp. 20-64-5]